MNEQIEHFDIVVVGGGMVGAAAALGLAQAGWSVAMIEHQAPVPFEPQSQPDLRVSAIGCNSVALLKQLGAWQSVAKMRATPYRGLETWEWDESKVSFKAQDLGLPELGYMVENRLIQLALWAEFEKASSLTLLCPDSLKVMQKNSAGWQLALDSGKVLQTRLIVGADGANSRVRQLSGIGLTGWQYRQSCMLIGIKTAEPQQDVTWQQFTPSGPRAFLPLHEGWASLVWYDNPQRIRQLSAMNMSQLTQEIQKTFPQRLGRIEAVEAGSFPLIRRHAQSYVQGGLVLLGDAAHTINPLAGQGVNLGYRDLDVLLDVLIKARDCVEPWDSREVLLRYERRRRPDNLLMQAGMDLFYKAFSNQLPPLSFIRNLALMAAQRAGKLKEWALKYALGL